MQGLFGTQLRQEGACAVLEALCTNSTLQKVDLGGNDLGPEVSGAAGGHARIVSWGGGGGRSFQYAVRDQHPAEARPWRQ